MESPVGKRNFKRCTECKAKLPSQDHHNLCLLCLGEAHKTAACKICLSFSKQTRRNRELRLRAALYDDVLSGPSSKSPQPHSSKDLGPAQSKTSKLHPKKSPKSLKRPGEKMVSATAPAKKSRHRALSESTPSPTAAQEVVFVSELTSTAPKKSTPQPSPPTESTSISRSLAEPLSISKPAASSTSAPPSIPTTAEPRSTSRPAASSTSTPPSMPTVTETQSTSRPAATSTSTQPSVPVTLDPVAQCPSTSTPNISMPMEEFAPPSQAASVSIPTTRDLQPAPTPIRSPSISREEIQTSALNTPVNVTTVTPRF
ncbi:putative protein TPRXL [Hemicordylus capensis]|uniref:putative protein TPRXL n=1 Tax=Hemicordylus capensis TaxID=884348 RepID=UPI0023048120|nr:putative protein TPRXL [Hemicordylus capensis]